MVSVCQDVAELFDGLPPAPASTRRKRYWTADEDKFIRWKHQAGLTITKIVRQLATNRWAIKKRLEQLQLLPQNTKNLDTRG